MLRSGGDQTADNAGFRRGGGRSLHDDRFRIGSGNHVFPQGCQTGFQLQGGEFAQIPERIELQPQQQSFFRTNVQFFLIERIKGFHEILEIGGKQFLFPVGPFLSGILAQFCQKPVIVPGIPVLDRIKSADFIEFHEFVIGLDLGIVAHGRQNSANIGGDPGGTEVAQHTDPLVALLDVKFAHIFETLDGIPDALIT